MAHDTLELHLRSSPALIADARKATETFAARHGFDDTAAGEIGLCVNEALANIIRHAYQGAADRPIELRLFMDGPLLRMELRDWGSGVVPKVDRPAPDPLTPGGIGVPCLRRLLDSIDFVPQSDGMLLKMTRRLDRSSDALA
ncbi:MAG: ATP-binding protein [Tepidisphaeraceae bacterium]